MRNASTRFSPVPATLTSAISRSMPGFVVVQLTTRWTGTSRPSCASICSITSGVPEVTMVMRLVCGGVIHLGDRQAFDIVAAAREQPDDARQHARFIVDEHGEGVALDLDVICSRISSHQHLSFVAHFVLRRIGAAASRYAPRPTGSSDSSSPSGSTRQSNSTGRFTSIISMILSSSSAGLSARRPTQPKASASLTKSGSASE